MSEEEDDGGESRQGCFESTRRAKRATAGPRGVRDHDQPRTWDGTDS